MTMRPRSPQRFVAGVLAGALAVAVAFGVWTALTGTRLRRGYPRPGTATDAMVLAPWPPPVVLDRPPIAVQGLGTLPSLGVLDRWYLGLGRPMIEDVAGHRAVASDTKVGLRFFALGDGRFPVEVGTLRSDETWGATLGAGGRRVVAYGTEGWSGDDGSLLPISATITAIDDLSRPEPVGLFPLETDARVLVPWRDAMLVGEYRFMQSALAGSLRVVELVGDAPGQEIGRLDGAVENLAVEGDRAYAVRSCDGRVQPTETPDPAFGAMPMPPMILSDSPYYPKCLAVVDLKDAGPPVLSGEVPVSGDHYPHAIAVHDGTVYMASHGEGIFLADANGPGAPVLRPEAFATNLDWPVLMDNFDAGGYLGLLINGSMLYLGNHTTIAAFDVSTPSAPRPVAAYELARGGYIESLSIDDDRLYVTIGDAVGSPFALWVLEAPADAAELLRAVEGMR